MGPTSAVDVAMIDTRTRTRPTCAVVEAPDLWRFRVEEGDGNLRVMSTRRARRPQQSGTAIRKCSFRAFAMDRKSRASGTSNSRREEGAQEGQMEPRPAPSDADEGITRASSALQVSSHE